MDPFVKVTGVVAPLDRVNIDTDQIIPAVFLKRIESTGFEDCLFFSWRFNEDGTPKEDFVLNQPPYENARVLVAGHNFGCGVVPRARALGSQGLRNPLYHRTQFR